MPKVQLSQRRVQSLKCPPDKTRTVYSDTTVAGLVLEKRRTGGATFYVRYRDAYGAQRNYRIGDASSVALDAARKKTIEVMSNVAAGGDPFAEKEKKRATPTVGIFFEEWYLPHAQSGKKSWKCDVGLFKHHIAPYIGKKRMDAVISADILQIKKAMRAKDYAEGTIDRVLILTRYMFNLAQRWKIGGVPENPCRTVDLYHPKNARERFLTKEEINRLLEELDRSRNRLLRYIVMLLLLTGARKQEVLRAAWEDFDLHHGFWLIPETKSGRPRSIPLSHHIRCLLDELPSNGTSQWLFPNPKTGVPFVTVFYTWDKARIAAGLADVRMHDLRHSFASFLVNSGRSIYEVKELLGHAHIKTTERYAHLDNTTLANAISAAGSFVDVGPSAAALPAPEPNPQVPL